jgi:GH15 family glucan-1,4-alpha-glucosidase
MYALFEYGVLPLQDIRLIRTMDWLFESLWTPGPIGGVARYSNDHYYRSGNQQPSNPWVISTLWMARWFMRSTPSPLESAQVMSLLSWVYERAGGSGMLPEQVDPVTGDRLSVSPLVWSHAEWVITLMELDSISQVEPHPWEGNL